MKKIVVLMTFTFSLFAELHPNLSGSYLEVKGYEGMSFLGDWIDLKLMELKFEKNEKEYRFYAVDERGWKNEIDQFELDRKVLSVFFHEISGDYLREIFLISEYMGKREVHSYSILNHFTSYSFYNNKYLDERINNRFIDKESIVAGDVRKVLDEMISYKNDIGHLEFWMDIEGEFFSGIDFLGGEFISYYDKGGQKVAGEDEASYYLIKYGDNIYGKFEKSFSYMLTEVFEGKEAMEKPYYVKNGRYERRDGYHYESGNYVEGIKEGQWQYNSRGENLEGKYENGERVGVWYINGMQGSLVNGQKDGVWKSIYGDYEEVYHMGNLIGSDS